MEAIYPTPCERATRDFDPVRPLFYVHTERAKTRGHRSNAVTFLVPKLGETVKSANAFSDRSGNEQYWELIDGEGDELVAGHRFVCDCSESYFGNQTVNVFSVFQHM